MKAISVVAAAFLMTLACAANAHTRLVKSDPAQRSEIAAAPKEAKLVFGGKVRLTSVTVASADGKSQALKPLPEDVVTEVSLPMPALTPGAYTINWRAAGADGHVMSGTIHFTIKPAATDASPAR